MKPILSCTILLALIICFTTCKKDDNGASTTLPEATQEGKNTFGMKVNGKDWTPYFSCGSFSNPCGAINIEYVQLASGLYYLSLGCIRKFQNDNSQLIIASKPLTDIKNTGNIYNSLAVSFTDYAPMAGWVSYSQPFRIQKGNFTITKIDFTNQIISGTFGFTLYSASDSMVITDGRFDSKFIACLCNK